MKLIATLVALLLLTACNRALVEKDDLEEIRRLTASTHQKVIHDLNQRMTNLEASRARDYRLLGELVKQDKKNAEMFSKAVRILDRIDQRQTGLVCSPIPGLVEVP